MAGMLASNVVEGLCPIMYWSEVDHSKHTVVDVRLPVRNVFAVVWGVGLEKIRV